MTLFCAEWWPGLGWAGPVPAPGSEGLTFLTGHPAKPMSTDTLQRLRRLSRPIRIGVVAAAVFLAGMLYLVLPVSDPLFRFGYDFLHLVVTHPPYEKITVIAMNETTDAKLGRKPDQPLSRLHHARLLQRLKAAGASRVCYDILFDQPSSDPAADEAFRQAIQAHGHVVLGAVEQVTLRNGQVNATEVIRPLEAFRKGAEGWGLLNVAPPDGDGVARRVSTAFNDHASLAAVAAIKSRGNDDSLPTEPAWYFYQVRPGDLTTLEFHDCLDPEKVPDRLLHEQTVFVGGQYSTAATGRVDAFPSPYSRFRAPEMFGVAWHATAFANLRDSLWLRRGGLWNHALWSLLIIGLWVGACLLPLPRWQLNAAAAVGAALCTVVSVKVNWDDRTLMHWPLFLVVLPALCCLGTRWVGRKPVKTEALQIFISAVSREFASYRSRIRDVIQYERMFGVTQEVLTCPGIPLLENIDRYVRASRYVIHLAGETAGYRPEASCVETLVRRYPELPAKFAAYGVPMEAGRPVLSMTQWEAYLALFHGRNLILAVARPDAQRDSVMEIPPEERAEQQDHIARLRLLLKKGIHHEFSNVDELCIKLLRSDVIRILKDNPRVVLGDELPPVQ